MYISLQEFEPNMLKLLLSHIHNENRQLRGKENQEAISVFKSLNHLLLVYWSRILSNRIIGRAGLLAYGNKVMGTKHGNKMMLSAEAQIEIERYKSSITCSQKI